MFFVGVGAVIVILLRDKIKNKKKKKIKFKKAGRENSREPEERQEGEEENNSDEPENNKKEKVVIDENNVEIMEERGNQEGEEDKAEVYLNIKSLEFQKCTLESNREYFLFNYFIRVYQITMTKVTITCLLVVNSATLPTSNTGDVVFTYIILFVWVIGLPVSLFVYLRNHQNSLMAPRMIIKYGTLYLNYRGISKDVYAFLMQLKFSILPIICVFFWQFPLIQLILLVLLYLFNVIFVTVYTPFCKVSKVFTEAISEGILVGFCIVIVAAENIPSFKQTLIPGYIVFGLTCSLLLLRTYRIVYDTIYKLKDLLKIEHPSTIGVDEPYLVKTEKAKAREKEEEMMERELEDEEEEKEICEDINPVSKINNSDTKKSLDDSGESKDINEVEMQNLDNKDENSSSAKNANQSLNLTNNSHRHLLSEDKNKSLTKLIPKLNLKPHLNNESNLHGQSGGIFVSENILNTVSKDIQNTDNLSRINSITKRKKKGRFFGKKTKNNNSEFKDENEIRSNSKILKELRKDGSIVNTGTKSNIKRDDVSNKSLRSQRKVTFEEESMNDESQVSLGKSVSYSVSHPPSQILSKKIREDSHSKYSPKGKTDEQSGSISYTSKNKSYLKEYGNEEYENNAQKDSEEDVYDIYQNKSKDKISSYYSHFINDSSMKSKSVVLSNSKTSSQQYTVSYKRTNEPNNSINEINRPNIQKSNRIEESSNYTPKSRFTHNNKSVTNPSKLSSVTEKAEEKSSSEYESSEYEESEEEETSSYVTASYTTSNNQTASYTSSYLTATKSRISSNSKISSINQNQKNKTNNQNGKK